MSAPLDYRSRTHSTVDPSVYQLRRRRLALWIGIPTVIILLLMLVSPIPASSRGSRTDAITGTVRYTRTNFFGLSSKTAYDTSPLETRLNAMNYKWIHRWEGGCTYSYNIFGRRMSVGCGIYAEIQSIGSELGDFASNASDDEILAFVKVMQTGSREEQRVVVQSVRNALVRDQYKSKSNAVASR